MARHFTAGRPPFTRVAAPNHRAGIILQSGGKWIGTQYGIKDPSIPRFDHNFLDTPATVFLDPDHLDFRLKPDAPMLKEGFSPIPQQDIGPRPQ